MLKTARAIRPSRGLKVAFDVESPELPQLLRQHPKPAVQDFLDASGMSLGEFNGFLFHPGGAKVLETVPPATSATCHRRRPCSPSISRSRPAQPDPT